MRYYNRESNEWYIEGRSLTRRTPEGVFSGTPTPEQLAAWGFEPYEEPQPEPLSEEAQGRLAARRRMAEIQAEFRRMDYLDHKEADGEDMSEYDEDYGGDWRAYRRGLRAEYNRIEKELQEADSATGGLGDSTERLGDLEVSAPGEAERYGGPGEGTD